MNEFLDKFPIHLRERLIRYAQDPRSFPHEITLAELRELPQNLANKDWQKVRSLIGAAEVRTLTGEDYGATAETLEVAEVEGFFVSHWPMPENSESNVIIPFTVNETQQKP